MFLPNPLVPEENTFHTANAESLVNVLQLKYNTLTNFASGRLDDYKIRFEESVLCVYKRIYATDD